MRVVAVGGRAFITAMRLGGAGGVVAESGEEAIREINKLIQNPDVGIILVSDEYGEEFSKRLNAIKARIRMPLIYQIAAPGSRVEPIDYRAILRQVLGI